ncbi:transposase, partial [Marinomonas arenicola]
HLVLHIDSETVRNWSVVDVLERWHKLHKGTTFTKRYLLGGTLPAYVIALAEAAAEAYRERLMDLSWF